MSYPPLPSSKDITSEQFLTYYLLYKFLVAYLASKPRRTPKFTPEPPSNLCDLDEIRFDSLPAILKEREAVDGQAWITKEELQELVAWKLVHGTFRATLPSLIASNPAQTVTEVTKAAFGRCKGITKGSHESLPQILKELSKLRGVGPATATLLLSVYKPDVMPYLSDESWRWVCWDDAAGWQKKIRYTLLEWSELLSAVTALGTRLTARASEVEKVAYVIGKFATIEGLEKEVRKLDERARAADDPARGKLAIEDRVATAIENSEINETEEKSSKGIQAIRKTRAKRDKRANLAAGEEESAEGREKIQEGPKAVPATEEAPNLSTEASASLNDKSGTRRRKLSNTSNKNANGLIAIAEPVSKRTRKR